MKILVLSALPTLLPSGNARIALSRGHSVPTQGSFVAAGFVASRALFSVGVVRCCSIWRSVPVDTNIRETVQNVSTKERYNSTCNLPPQNDVINLLPPLTLMGGLASTASGHGSFGGQVCGSRRLTGSRLALHHSVLVMPR